MFMALNFGALMITNQLIDFMLPEKKTLRRSWHIDKRTHNSLLHTTYNCLPIDIKNLSNIKKYLLNFLAASYTILLIDNEAS